MFISIQNYLINTDDVKCIALWAAAEKDNRPRIVVTYKNGAYNSFEYTDDDVARLAFCGISLDQLPSANGITRDQLARSLE